MNNTIEHLTNGDFKTLSLEENKDSLRTLEEKNQDFINATYELGGIIDYVLSGKVFKDIEAEKKLESLVISKEVYNRIHPGISNASS